MIMMSSIDFILTVKYETLVEGILFFLSVSYFFSRNEAQLSSLISHLQSLVITLAEHPQFFHISLTP